MANQTDSMVQGRSKRNNAGARMAELLNREDCDEFYQSTYGGFFDEEGDDAYESPVESDSDYIDSDFDIEENEQANVNEGDDDEDYEDESEKKKKAKGYKEPAFHQQPGPSATATDNERKRKHTSDTSKKDKGYYRPLSPPPEKQLRASTVLKSEEYERLREEKMEKRRRRKKYRRAADYYVQLSQAELLQEAKKTEESNLKSVERFHQYELEKRKRHRGGKQRIIKGPFIRYLSLTMPAGVKLDSDAAAPLRQPIPNVTPPTSGLQSRSSLDDSQSATKRFYLGDEQTNSIAQTSGHTTPSVDVEPNGQSDNGDANGTEDNTEPGETLDVGKRARTFITFSEDATFAQCVPDSRRRPKPVAPKPQYCVVTALPAKYFDPLTKLPYANSEAFRIIREAYYKHIEQNGDKNDPAVAEWLQARAVSS